MSVTFLINAAARLAARYRSQAAIEFRPDGTIFSANPAFLAMTGYHIDEIFGQHHAIFVSAAERNSPEYREFWAALKRGERRHARVKRLAKDGGELWLEASYNPVLALGGKVIGVTMLATDVTLEQKFHALLRRQIETSPLRATG